MLWLGGMLFLIFVLVPVLGGESPELRGRLVDRVGVRFRAVGWVCLLLLLITGAVNIATRGYSFLSPLLLGKLGTVGVILVLSFLHDFVIGPRATEAMERGTEDAERLRRLSALIGRVNTLLALVVVALGVMLVRGY
ncbi:MAG: DUF4149 domain-containing protein [Euryarchaeota archaeon]|nr:DUF4149 domain-containing protein [Euryarchaeota archaeon]